MSKNIYVSMDDLGEDSEKELDEGELFSKYGFLGDVDRRKFLRGVTGSLITASSLPIVSSTALAAEPIAAYNFEGTGKYSY